MFNLRKKNVQKNCSCLIDLIKNTHDIDIKKKISSMWLLPQYHACGINGRMHHHDDIYNNTLDQLQINDKNIVIIVFFPLSTLTLALHVTYMSRMCIIFLYWLDTKCVHIFLVLLRPWRRRRRWLASPAAPASLGMLLFPPNMVGRGCCWSGRPVSGGRGGWCPSGAWPVSKRWRKLPVTSVRVFLGEFVDLLWFFVGV